MHENISFSLANPSVIIAILIFLTSYAVILAEKVHRTIIALLGSTIMIIAGVLMNFYDQEKGVEAIDFNTLGLLIGMMIIVTITKDTGLFQYLAIKSAKFAKGEPWKILVMFSLLTAVSSALLDNVTTVLLMVPMTLVICDHLKINPKPFLFSLIIMSNLGGTATLIGDPPNILIGSAAGLSFMDFIINLAPVAAINIIIMIPLIKLIYGKRIKDGIANKMNILNLNENESLVDLPLLKKTLFVLAIVMLGFFFHGKIGLEGATIALFGAAVLLLLDKKNPERALKEIEWTTIFFFAGLFVLVGGLEAVGAIKASAEQLIKWVDGNNTALIIGMIWASGIFSAFIDNIPFVATIIPMVHEMGASIADLEPIWWSLALGACLGGNGTIIGASANMVVAGISEKSGYKIGFLEYMKIGMLSAFISLIISSIYVYLRFII